MTPEMPCIYHGYDRGNLKSYRRLSVLFYEIPGLGLRRRIVVHPDGIFYTPDQSSVVNP
jgi:hypothetical protein